MQADGTRIRRAASWLHRAPRRALRCFGTPEERSRHESQYRPPASCLGSGAVIPVMALDGPRRMNAAEAPFWDGLGHGSLRLPRCNGCGTWCWPPQPRCAACGGWEIGWQDVAPHAVVHSFTRTWHAFTPQAKALVPFVTVLAELPQAGGIRLLGMLEGPEAALSIGAPLRARCAPPEMPEGLPRLLWHLAGYDAPC